MRPQSILMFEKLYLGALALGLVNYFLSWDEMMEQLNADPDVAAIGLASSGFVIGTAVFSYAISLLFWFFIARKASSVAKWILVVFTVIGVLSVPSVLMEAPLVMGAFTAVITVMQIAAVILLFRDDAKLWFENKGRTQDIAQTFE